MVISSRISRCANAVSCFNQIGNMHRFCSFLSSIKRSGIIISWSIFSGCRRILIFTFLSWCASLRVVSCWAVVSWPWAPWAGIFIVCSASIRVVLLCFNLCHIIIKPLFVKIFNCHLSPITSRLLDLDLRCSSWSIVHVIWSMCLLICIDLIAYFYILLSSPLLLYMSILTISNTLLLIAIIIFDFVFSHLFEYLPFFLTLIFPSIAWNLQANVLSFLNLCIKLLYIHFQHLKFSAHVFKQWESLGWGHANRL